MEKDELVLVDMIEKLKNDEISYFKDPTQDKQNKILDSYNKILVKDNNKAVDDISYQKYFSKQRLLLRLQEHESFYKNRLTILYYQLLSDSYQQKWIWISYIRKLFNEKMMVLECQIYF